MDGWRLGYLTAPSHMIPAMLKISMNDVTHVNTFIQYGGLAAVTASPDAVNEMTRDDQNKRDMVVRALNAMPGVTCTLPEGTIYAFANIEATGRDSTSIATALLEKAEVVVEDGAFYGPSGQGHLRICFGSQTRARLEEALERMATFFSALQTPVEC
jgi:aspartate aminotransferase